MALRAACSEIENKRSHTRTIPKHVNLPIPLSTARKHHLYDRGRQCRLLYIAMGLGDYRIPGMHFHAARRIFCRLLGSGLACARRMDGRYSGLLAYKLAITLYGIDAYSTASASIDK